MKMIDVWAVWPSANPDQGEKTALRWLSQGFKVALLLDSPHTFEIDVRAIVGEKWEGYPKAMNRLCREIDSDIVVAASDDIYPDERSAQELGREFIDHFQGTFGVMSPIGDDFGNVRNAAVAPWIGREWINRAYGGHGPFWSEYFHYFCDGEIQDVAILLDAFWQREDVIQYHDHWQREEGGGTRPPHLFEALKQWKKDKCLYEFRKANGFPGHERVR